MALSLNNTVVVIFQELPAGSRVGIDPFLVTHG